MTPSVCEKKNKKKETERKTREESGLQGLRFVSISVCKISCNLPHSLSSPATLSTDQCIVFHPSCPSCNIAECSRFIHFHSHKCQCSVSTAPQTIWFRLLFTVLEISRPSLLWLCFALVASTKRIHLRTVYA